MDPTRSSWWSAGSSCKWLRQKQQLCMEMDPTKSSCWWAIISFKSWLGYSPNTSEPEKMEDEGRLQVSPLWKMLTNNPSYSVKLPYCTHTAEIHMEAWKHLESPYLLTEEKLATHKLFADLPTLRAVGNYSILDTSARPDIETVEEQCVAVVELTIPFNSPESLLNTKTGRRTRRTANSHWETWNLELLLPI